MANSDPNTASYSVLPQDVKTIKTTDETIKMAVNNIHKLHLKYYDVDLKVEENPDNYYGKKGEF